jgi:MutS domain V
MSEVVTPSLNVWNAMISHKKQAKLQALRRHLARLERRLKHLDTLSQRYSRVRWGIVLVGILTTLLVNRTLGAWDWIAAGVFVALFLLVASSHGRVKESITRHQFWHRLKATHVARMTRDWTHLPLPLVVPSEGDHPFATDLNLSGARSLHQLLDTTMSRGGSERLRKWLLHLLIEPEDVRARQDMVRELVPLAAFRDRLALHGARVASNPDERWEGEHVLAWLERHPIHTSLAPWVLLLAGLACLNIVFYVLHVLALVPVLWPFSLVLYLGLYMVKSSEIRDFFEDAFRLEKTLNQFRAILVYLETWQYDRTPHLANLCAPFWRAEKRPSVYLRRIVRIAGAASAQKANVLGLLLNALVPWDLYFAYRFSQYKEEVKAHLPVWIETWYELEALNALANFGYLHPDNVFPEVLPLAVVGKQPVLRACDLGHPLLPDAVQVCNDFTLENVGEIIMITGSNMSGKSTFLRTLGVNLCLAYAGAPVNASVFSTIPFRLFTCITVSDSVTDGISYFYAEVRRLKALLQAFVAEHAYPLFFLIDEIFRGTNNRERLIGSHAYLQTLTGGNGVGVVSTHDLDLVTLARENPGIRNYHFREDIRDGRMVFDYRLRPGPCPTTNALKIMQMEGLPVALSHDGVPQFQGGE